MTEKKGFFDHSRTPSLDDLGENTCHSAWMRYIESHGSGFDLSGSNPTRAELPRLEPSPEDMAEALSAAYTASPQGIESARRAVADYYGDPVRPERIQLFASTSEAVGAIMKLLCAPGDRVVTCTPTYPLLDCLTSLEAAELSQVPLQDCAGEWTIDFWTLDKTCCDKTRALIVVSPNNPTGHCIRRDEMAKAVRFCAERRMALIVDEVFAGYRMNADPELMPQAAAAHFEAPGNGLIISMSGLSKVCGLPQHKLGWGIFGGDPQVAGEAMQRMSFITDSTLSVSGWVQRMAPWFLRHHGDFSVPCNQRMRVDFDILREFEAADGTKWRLDRVDGGWSACIRLPGWCDDEAIAARLAQNGVRVFPGAFFGYRANQPTLVVSLITPPDILRRGMTRLAALLDDMI